MPTYTYQVINEDGSEGEIFEFFQKISEPALEKHPLTNQKVKRIIAYAPNLNKKTAGKDLLSHENLSQQGFTKYERSGETSWTKTAGIDGPDKIGL